MEKITYRKTLDVHKNGIQFTLQGFETNDNMSRRIEISLMASGDTYDLPLEGVVALMYITTPNADEPSIEECTIKDNTIVYDVLPIVEEGITEMQLKLIGTNYDGATAVLVAPRFTVEVAESNADDVDAEQSTSFSALENAAAKASYVYNSRLVRIEFDDTCVFKAYYADGTVYESDELRRLLLQNATDVNLATMVTEGMTNIAADDVANVLEERFSEKMHTAEYTNSLANVFTKPTFVQWDKNTENTPYSYSINNPDNALTSVKEGFAICYGDTLNHTAVAWTKGDDGASTYIRRIINGTPKEWQTYLTEQGGTIKGLLKIKPAPESTYATLSLSDADGARVGLLQKDPKNHYVTLWSKAAKSDNGDNHTFLRLASETAPIEDMVMLQRAVNGKTGNYKLYGEHNVPHPAQIFTGTYEGTGEGSEAYNKTITPPFKPQIVYLEGHTAVRPSGYAYKTVPSVVTCANVSWSESNNSVTFSRVTGSAGSGTKFNEKGKIYTYTIVG